ncbi:hypothetical protein Ciccas_002929 [Cichlidogyrus casuarinus]|uniref:Transporter n=1 Tax=Cichlidogyrus casuarinus TaxID=1844966 RepID=A0ABD2QFU1_9PLAT
MSEEQSLRLSKSNRDGKKANQNSKLVVQDLGEGVYLEINRAKFANKIDFLFACIGFSVGLGNVWRFPYLCFKHGGGAFLIPYLISLLIGGFPSFLLEVSLGQLMSAGGIEAWDIFPLLKGIGYTGVIVGFFLTVYYNVIIAWGLHFMFSSFQLTLPWTICGDWSTVNCVNLTSINRTHADGQELTDSAVEYWENRVLHLSTGLEDSGKVLYELALCLLLGWIIIFCCVIKGIKTSGKVLYFTAPFPYVLLFIILIRTCLLPGALDGLKHYVTPNFTKLGELQVWADAGTQVFFSYSIGLGTLTALGSYNSFTHNSFRDCIIFAVVNSGTSLFAGLVIFATAGYMAQAQQIPIAEAAASGPGLAFIIYPQALAQMPGAPFWSVMFFIMILLLGMNTQFVALEGVVAGMTDIFPVYFSKGHRRTLFTGLTCIVMFIIGLSMVTEGGMYVFQLFDYYIGSRITLVVAAIQCLVIVYGFGGRRYLNCLEKMYGFSVGKILLVFWSSLTPLFCMALFLITVFVYQELDYEKKTTKTVYKYPQWSIVLGWMMACTCILALPIIAMYKLLTTPGATFNERLLKTIEPVFPPRIAAMLNDTEVICESYQSFLLNLISFQIILPVRLKSKLLNL